MRYEYLGSRVDLTRQSMGQFNNGRADWQRAWHGCKIDSIYSIMYKGRLTASCDYARGHRFFRECPGVYCHNDATRLKCLNYTRFVPLFRDGTFWTAGWELRVDRSDRIVKRTDQWIQEERSVQLDALWVFGATYQHLQYGSQVSRIWDPWHEANPCV